METVLTSKLRAWRNENDVTLEELSDLSGYSPAMLSRVERGERHLSALARIRLARSLGVKVRDIFPVDEA
jgi:transcriptional regulator with XRE-family HTH domain